MHLEPKCHILIHHTILVDHLYLLGGILLDLFAIVNYPQERVSGVQTIAVLRVWEENTYTFGEAAE